MKIVITGGRGLLGSTIVRQLLSRGHDCVVVQRTPSEILGAHEILQDLTDSECNYSWLAGADAVIHLAAKVGIVGTQEQFYAANVGATSRLLTAVREQGVPRFVFASSPSVAHVGSSLMGVGASIAKPDQVRGWYSKTKAIAELEVLAANSAELSTIALRPHLVWGPGDTQLIGRIVQRAQARRLFLIGGGFSLIDTTYVTNAAEAFVLAAESPQAGSGTALMVSNGEPRMVRELLERICMAAGVAPPTRSVSFHAALAAGYCVEKAWVSRESEPPLTSFLVEQLGTAHWFDISQTRELLNWSPSVSLEQGFMELARAFANQP